MSYSVGRLSKLVGISVRTLHHYDEIGLLTPSERTRAGYRRYSDAEVERLRQILAYRELGFDLARIKRILDDSAVDPIEQLRHHKAELHAEVGRLEQSLRRVETMLEPEMKSGVGPVREDSDAVSGLLAHVKKSLGIAAAGFVVGLALVALGGGPFNWPAVGVIVTAAMFLARSSVTQRSHLVFQVWNLLLWIGFWLGMVVEMEGAEVRLALTCLKFALASAVIGMAIVSTPPGSGKQLFRSRSAQEPDARTRIAKRLWAMVPAAYGVVFLGIVMSFANPTGGELDLAGRPTPSLSREAILAGYVEALITTVVGVLVVVSVSLYRSRRTQTPA